MAFAIALILFCIIYDFDNSWFSSWDSTYPFSGSYTYTYSQETGILKATIDKMIPQMLKMTKLYLGWEYYVISPPATQPPMPPIP